jgi:hypothetical protein
MQRRSWRSSLTGKGISILLARNRSMMAFYSSSLALTISATATHGWIESVSDESASSMIPITGIRKFAERPLLQCLKTATLPLIGLPTVS